VDGFCHQLFAGACLAEDEDGAVGGSDNGYQLEYLLHGAAGSDHFSEAMGCLDLFLQVEVFFFQPEFIMMDLFQLAFDLFIGPDIGYADGYLGGEAQQQAEAAVCEKTFFLQIDEYATKAFVVFPQGMATISRMPRSWKNGT